MTASLKQMKFVSARPRTRLRVCPHPPERNRAGSGSEWGNASPGTFSCRPNDSDILRGNSPSCRQYRRTATFRFIAYRGYCTTPRQKCQEHRQKNRPQKRRIFAPSAPSVCGFSCMPAAAFPIHGQKRPEMREKPLFSGKFFIFPPCQGREFMVL